MPEHPLYETIEVALSPPRADGRPVVRIWLTERAGRKRQTYYFNDEAIARTFGQEAHFADVRIDYRGRAGFARHLELAFEDKDRMPIRWEMNFPENQPVSTERAGLKAQNEHAAESVMLFWYTHKRADGGTGQARFGDIEYNMNANDRPGYGYRAAYNEGASLAVFSYGEAEIVATPDGFSTSFGGGRHFVRQPRLARPSYRAELGSFGQPAAIEIEEAAGRVLRYRHSQGNHAMVWEMPSRGNGDAPFTLSIGDLVVARGIFSSGEAQGFAQRLTFSEPAWARATSLNTFLAPTERGYRMRVAAIG